MSKKNGTEVVTETEVTAKPVVDKDKLVKLFETYDQQSKRIEGLKGQIDKVTSERSETVKGIFQANGEASKLRRAGTELTIIKRDNTYFFRGVKSTDGITEV